MVKSLSSPRMALRVLTPSPQSSYAHVFLNTFIFRGQIVDMTGNVFSIQLTGTTDKLDAFISALGETVVLEVARTGVSGISRGEKVLSL